MSKKWIDSNGKCTYNDIPAIYEKLPPDIYELKFDSFAGQFYLDRMFNKFSMPDKIYELEVDLINRIKTTFNGYNKNFGILLKGLKGTGKTVVAKIVSNDLNLPVILITKAYTDIGAFINSINQDIIILFDEFEKIYNLNEYAEDEGDESNLSNLLTLMDGVFTSKYKRLFILTTNKEYLPDAMLSRPSRIRYVKNFTDLSKTTIENILNDLVENKELIPKLIEYIKLLEIITVDIVKSIAEEANLYNKADIEFFDIFNVKKNEAAYEIYEEVKGKVKYFVERITKANLVPGRHLYAEEDDGNYLGRIKRIDNQKNEIFIDNINPTHEKVHKFKFRKKSSYHYSFF